MMTYRKLYPNNVFENILNDSNNYRFVDLPIAQGNNSEWSFPNWPSHLDHIHSYKRNI